MLKNEFYNQIKIAEDNNAGVEKLIQLLGRIRSKKGMFVGNMNDGELEIGQVSTLVKSILPAADIVNEIWAEYNMVINGLHK